MEQEKPTLDELLEFAKLRNPYDSWPIMKRINKKLKKLENESKRSKERKEAKSNP